VILGAVPALWGSGDLLATVASRRAGARRTLAIAQVTELCIGLAVWAVFRPSFAPGAGSVPALLATGVPTAAAYGGCTEA
jgi:hypothetical protein